MKKFGFFKIALALLLVFATLCASGCGIDLTKEDETTTTTTTTEEIVDTTPEVKEPSKWVSAIFGGGPFVSGGTRGAKVLKKMGFNTIIIWSVHVHENGDLVLNDIPVVKNGEVVASKQVLDGWKSLREGETCIERIEISVGAWGCADFENIKSLIERDGTGEDTILYKNFKLLIEATGADAVNYDDESCYDVASATKFGKMCEAMGVKVALCPYTRMDFWKALYKNLGSELCDRIYVQCYAGGAYNKPADWARELGTEVIPGYWCLHGSEGDTAAAVNRKLKNDKNSITGGFMWLYDDMQSLKAPNATVDYAEAINSLNPYDE